MPRNNEETPTKRPKYVRPEKKIPVGPIPADDWQALFFETDEDDLVDEDTVSVVRVACWASVGGRVAGLIPTTEGLAPADDEEGFRGYVDARVKDAAGRAIDAWNEVEEDSE